MEPGKIIQNYRLTRFLGDGGMGQVWLAEHTLLGRKVAIKSLHPQLARNAAIRARFKQEAATLAHLQHPGIVALHDYIEENEGAYLVMEYVDGTPLDDYIARTSGPIPDAQLREMFAQILEGFAYAHGQQIVHRDIKPSNFLVTREGKVKILDFGIAKILNDGERKLTKTGTNLGTVLYMSPEQVQGQAVDQRSDIYSLGVTLFQMATGKQPYSPDAAEYYVYDQIVNHPLPSARAVYPGVTEATEQLISKATQKQRDARYQSCAEFLAALRQSAVRNDLPKTEVDRPVPVVTPAHVVPPPVTQHAAAQAQPPAPSPTKSSKMPLMIGVGVVVILAVFLGIWKFGPYSNAGGSSSSSDPGSSVETSTSGNPDDTRTSDSDNSSQSTDSPSGAVAAVRSFYRYLGNEDYGSAYALTDNPKWPTYEGFSSVKGFGCVNESRVYFAEKESCHANTCYVKAKAYMGDPCNGNGTFTLRYKLENRAEGWIIVKSEILGSDR